jgi:hypothetical protein
MTQHLYAVSSTYLQRFSCVCRAKIESRATRRGLLLSIYDPNTRSFTTDYRTHTHDRGAWGGVSRICEREHTAHDDTLYIGRGRKLRERAGGRCCAFVLRAHDILLLSRSVYGSITLESIRRVLTHVKLPGLDPDTSLQ